MHLASSTLEKEIKNELTLVVAYSQGFPYYTSIKMNSAVKKKRKL